jgi:ribosomal protein S18 acetylase RimI-like enzyme
MYTDPAYRGKGVNKAVMEFLYDWSRSRGIYEIRLEVYPNNPAAIRAYEKAGMTTGLHMMRVDLRERREEKKEKRKEN